MDKWITLLLERLGEKGIIPSEIDQNLVQFNNINIQFVNEGENSLSENTFRIIIHRDSFERNPTLLLSRIQSILGKNTTSIYGRNTQVITLKKVQTRDFINENHLMGFGGGKYFFGLIYHNQLVAVAVFSKILYMKYENPPYYSAELERYCSQTGVTVVGGLDKLIKAFIKRHPVDDLVTYIDQEWSEGKAYENIGFHKIGETPPLEFWVNRDTWKRKLASQRNKKDENEYLLKNKGNIKMRREIIVSNKS